MAPRIKFKNNKYKTLFFIEFRIYRQDINKQTCLFCHISKELVGKGMFYVNGTFGKGEPGELETKLTLIPFHCINNNY